MTDFFNFQMTRFDLYRSAVPLLADAIERSGSERLVDLCSGGGGPHQRLAEGLEEALGRPFPITLTDKYPNLDAFERAASDAAAVGFRTEPVDATAVPEELAGFRTLFSSFHHFPPDLARAILQDSLDKGAPIGVFELSRRDLSAFLEVMLGGPLGMLFTTPMIKPRRASRFLFTYALPAIPFFAVWDGVASNLRAYDPDELDALVQSLEGPERYEWSIGRTKGPVGVKVTHLIGTPRA